MKTFLLFCTVLFSSTLSAENRQTVSFSSADGGTVYANYFYSGSKAVVLAHGAIFNKESWAQLTKKLLKNDISVLAIDFRGYGQSTPGDRPADKYEDVLAAVRFLHTQSEINQVAVLGASMGGGAVAQAAIYSKPEEINQLILLSPVPVKAPEKLKGNILYIASKDESLAHSVISQFQKTPEPKQLELIEGKAHAQHIFKTSNSTELTEIIINFLNKK